MKLLPNKNSSLSELMPFGKIQYVVTDLDGTLIQGNNSVFERIAASVSYLRTKKISFSIATGRSLNGVRTVLDETRLAVGMPIILYNGTVIVRNKTKDIISSGNISMEAALQVKKLTQAFSISAYASQLNEDVYRENEGRITPECETVWGWGVECREHDYNGLPIIWSNDGSIASPTTIVLEYHDEEEIPSILSALKSIPNINVTTSGTGYIELAPNNCDKGTALQIVRQTCKWSSESVLCIGDNDNDVSLLVEADIGVAVSNASPSAKQVADYICERPNVQGVVDVCDVLLSAKRFSSD